MLKASSDIHGYAIDARDGPIGTITDFLFDDASWRVRWLVVDTGDLLPGRKVLLPATILRHGDDGTHPFLVGLTRQEVKDSPGLDSEKPVSRQMETHLYDYYGWSPYWSTGFYMGGYGYGAGMLAPPLASGFSPERDEGAMAERGDGDPRLRSVHEVRGYHIHASDGEIGHVADFLIEDVDWSIHYLVVDTQNWWPGKKVLISPRSVETTDWATRSLTVGVDRSAVKDSPDYDGSTVVDRAYERGYHQYYGHLPINELA